MRLDERARRDTFKSELVQLRRLGVRFEKLGARKTESILARFAAEFVEPTKSAAFLLAASRGHIDHLVWLRSELAKEAPRKGMLRWLSAGQVAGECLRLDRQARLPALRLALDTIDESWLCSWPGAYLHFESGRALLITLDYEVLGCDLRTSARSPYR